MPLRVQTKGENYMAKIKKRTGAIGAVLIIISMIIGIFIGYLIGRSTAVVPTPSEDDVTHVVGTPVVEEPMEVETSVEETEIEIINSEYVSQDLIDTFFDASLENYF